MRYGGGSSKTDVRCISRRCLTVSATDLLRAMGVPFSTLLRWFGLSSSSLPPHHRPLTQNARDIPRSELLTRRIPNCLRRSSPQRAERWLWQLTALTLWKLCKPSYCLRFRLAFGDWDVIKNCGPARREGDVFFGSNSLRAGFLRNRSSFCGCFVGDVWKKKRLLVVGGWALCFVLF